MISFDSLSQQSQGLENFTKTTLEDIGKIFGVTKECIRQTEARALNKLKNSLAY